MKKNYTYVYNDLPQHVIQLQITWLSWYLRVFFSSLNKLLSRLHLFFTFLKGYKTNYRNIFSSQRYVIKFFYISLKNSGITDFQKNFYDREDADLLLNRE